MIRILRSVTELTKSPSQVLLIGTKKSFESQFNKEASSPFISTLLACGNSSNEAGERPAKLAKVDSSDKLDLIKTIVSELRPSTDASASGETWMVNASGKGTKVSICVLPTAVSRHNTSSRPHQIAEYVKKARAGGEMLVGLVLEDPSHAMPTGCAVARAGMLYSRKNGSVNGVPTLAETKGCGTDAFNVVFSAVDEKDIDHIQYTAEGIQLACRLVDAPPNELHTDAFVEEARTVAAAVGAKIEVIRGEDLNKHGLGGIYGVGKAAVHPPSMVVLSHIPKGKENAKSITVVGKGIVYDTGGLSIKGKDFMPGMKRDMGGAAALLGAFSAAVRAGCSTPLHCILCLAENAVGPVATKPDDVHIMYSKKSVEINNTDAEGRLVLGDGVAYAVDKLNPEVICDMATLTGAQGVACGRYFGALYCNNEELESAAVRAGKYTGDLCHPVPYAPEFFRAEFKSAVADMKNSVKNRDNAQVSCAGQFIGNHLGDFQEHGKWIHVDMASPAFTKGDERATGYGVALIQGLLKELNAL